MREARAAPGVVAAAALAEAWDAEEAEMTEAVPSALLRAPMRPISDPQSYRFGSRPPELRVAAACGKRTAPAASFGSSCLSLSFFWASGAPFASARTPQLG